MPLQKPTPEDEKKLHSEINQLLNQRFILTTLAFTLFSVLAAWMVPKGAVHGPDIGAFPFAISIVIEVLLSFIYLWTHSLRHSARVLSSYLVETGKSGWEVEWRRFLEERSFFSQTRQQTLIFIV